MRVGDLVKLSDSYEDWNGEVQCHWGKVLTLVEEHYDGTAWKVKNLEDDEMVCWERGDGQGLSYFLENYWLLPLTPVEIAKYRCENGQ